MRAAVSLSSDGSDGSDSNTSDGSDPGSDMDQPRCLSECDAEVLLPVRAILARCGLRALPTPSPIAVGAGCVLRCDALAL